MTYIIRFRVGAGRERKVRIRNCNNKEHAEIKYRAWAARKFEGYVVMLGIEPNKANNVSDIFNSLN